jgi:hypothetical protein
MNKPNNISTEVRIITRGRREHNGLPSDLNEVRFGTLRVSPIKVAVSTNTDTEDPHAYQEADRAFEHVRAHLILLAKVLETDLGPGWSIMVEDGED